jgi:tRNA-binding EMAP/Myf-like protein
VVSGLVKHYGEAEMQQRKILVICNLKPAAMRGITSQAMVLCATAPDSGKVCAAGTADSDCTAQLWPWVRLVQVLYQEK